MTDMTESTELLAFKRQDDGYKVTVISWDELKIPQNLLAYLVLFISCCIRSMLFCIPDVKSD